ncbi:hypothetical protein NECAME_04331 [Necator americanus]|uniref:Uncharacterized protein n=1 Tax=Necator americanus TaxID=51031 RepID=W2SV01_NECAM|nr:hypothetical protein NECAME_04331 [Necator americanus]ETN73333.1 hypothetical protein NECAME_04331 [Necator americanus]
MADPAMLIFAIGFVLKTHYMSHCVCQSVSGDDDDLAHLSIPPETRNVTLTRMSRTIRNTRECACPPGPRGDRGPPGPPGLRGFNGWPVGYEHFGMIIFPAHLARHHTNERTKI